ncbi:serine hydrolase domain-containing protein [Ulvibacterium sp.]|uniref:serine hydrolase domain-containing protein n=1 Tax=Ulvibacterium sp. TaxID=2665914 RepID=UPI003BA99391
MKPILTFLKNFLAQKRIVGNATELEGLAKVDAILATLINERRVPGISITVLGQGEVLLQKGYGYTDLDLKTRVEPKKTIFRIASVSKPIAATALAQMVKAGVMDLDASFYKYVPYFPKKRWDFSIRQLAGHTAGIRGYRGKEYGLNEPYSIKESITIFKDDDLLFQPGTAYHYNSFDWVMISLAMQEASGMAFEDYVRQKVLLPLGMDRTFAEYPPDHDFWAMEEAGISGNFNRTTFYSKNRHGFRKSIPVNNYYKIAGGGYLSTTEDIAKLGQAYLDGKIVDKEVVSQFLTSGKIKDNPTYYGLGWEVSRDKRGRPFYGHIGNGIGGYSNFFVYPELQMVFAILINCTDPKVQTELDEVVDILSNLHASPIL